MFQHLNSLFTFIPKGSLLFWVTMSILADLITGVAKSVLLGRARTSTGFRKTLIKFCQYGGAIAISFIIGNVAQQQGFVDNPALAQFMTGGLFIYIIYVEVVSICENMIEAGPDTSICKYLFTPLHKVLTIQLKNNPITAIVNDTNTKDEKE